MASVDPLFRSAAWAYGLRAVGVVLSGGLDDGTAGLWAIKTCGGTTVVQEPAEALYPEMPSNALLHNQVDYRLPLSDIGPLLVRLATEPRNGAPAWNAPESIKDEIDFAKVSGNDMQKLSKLGLLSPFTCPSCRGALWEIEESGHLRYRCHTGHAFSQASLLVEQSTEAERSVYVALRAVEEKAGALRRLAKQWKGRAPEILAEYESRAAELESTADVLRALLAGEKT
jgi:two-component system chemotaxis response regulator CheB